MSLYLHLGRGIHRNACRPEEIVGETHQVVCRDWSKESAAQHLSAHGPTHLAWVSHSDTLRHPVTCIRPLLGEDGDSLLDRIDQTLDAVALVRVKKNEPQPAAKLKEPPKEPPKDGGK